MWVIAQFIKKKEENSPAIITSKVVNHFPYIVLRDSEFQDCNMYHIHRQTDRLCKRKLHEWNRLLVRLAKRKTLLFSHSNSDYITSFLLIESNNENLSTLVRVQPVFFIFLLQAFLDNFLRIDSLYLPVIET